MNTVWSLNIMRFIIHNDDILIIVNLEGRNSIACMVRNRNMLVTMELLKSNGEAGYVLGNIVKKTGEDVELQ